MPSPPLIGCRAGELADETSVNFALTAVDDLPNEIRLLRSAT